MQRRLWLGIVLGTTLATTVLASCSSAPVDGDSEIGTLRVPLSAHGPSGAEYRLRDAVFEISSEYYYYDGSASGGDGGTSGPAYTISSEDDPEAEALSISVERGYYYVRLLPGWRMEKVSPGPDEEVEAQLLSGAAQWVYVSPHSSSWVEFQFGIGDRELWFNGELNIGVSVYEDPSDLYGYGGAPGGGGVGGEWSIGGANGG